MLLLCVFQVNLNFKATGGATGRRERGRQGVPGQKKGKEQYGKGRGTFSADNPYGKRAKSDGRQFSK